jgi:hypothetical protein
MTENFDKFYNSVLEACWKGYKKVGMKKKGNKKVPNCVPAGKVKTHKKEKAK